VQRWVDLLAALLRRSFPATREELAREVPAYADPTKRKDAFEKMFERDKEDLRAYGVPIRTETSPDGTVSGYRLDRRDFYLPYLALAAPTAASPGAASRPARARGDFYRALGELAVDGQALALVAEAARRVESLADPQLAADARAGARKLAFDQPAAVRLDDAAHAGDAQVVDGDHGVSAKMFVDLGDAVLQRRAVAFAYRTMETDATNRRRVEPYGLHLTGGHWYLVGRDRDRGALRTFRVSRVRELEFERDRPGEPASFDVPAASACATSPATGGRGRSAMRRRRRPSWSSAARPARPRRRSASASASGNRSTARRRGPIRCRYHVRRTDAFVRWLLGLAGDARPVAPPALVDEYRLAVGAAAARYRTSEGDVSSSVTRRAVARRARPAARVPETAVAQLRRLLDLLPRLADGVDHGLDEVATRRGSHASRSCATSGCSRPVWATRAGSSKACRRRSRRSACGSPRRTSAGRCA
jgi:proteasome accessory factor B